jgi:RND family efflux transporter MFP subunit
MRVITQQVESAKAQATEAKAALSRAEKVEGALSKEAFAQRRTAMETTAAAQAAAEAQLEAAAAAAADARTKLDYSSIVSPADGIVSIRNIAAGEVVSSANNPLFVVDSNTREIEVDLSSTQRESLSDLSRAVIPGKDVSLKLRWISPEVYASGNTARARFALTGKETLTPGTRVSLRLSLAEREAIRLPLRALQKTDKGWQAFVVKDGKAVGRPVAVQEPILGNSVAIESGVSVGDHVVVDGADFVADGMAVTEAGSPR